jgi:hypothetical protein
VAKSEVLLVHFNEGNVWDHEECTSRRSLGRDLYPGHSEHKARKLPHIL